MESVEFVVYLQSHAKEFRYITVKGKNRLQCILVLLHYVKYNEIDMYYYNALHGAFSRI